MYKKYVKRVLDKYLSLVFIIILIALYIIIYKQNRLGLNGKIFKIYKFNTLKNEKVSKLGIVLRTFSLDKIPQFLTS